MPASVYLMFGLVFLLLTVPTLLLLNTEYKQVQKLELQNAILIARLRELGVLTIYEKGSLGGIQFKYTEEAIDLMNRSFFPSTWNLRRHLDFQAYQREQVQEIAKSN